MKKELEIEITVDGDVSIKVRGAKGKECVELTEFLETALGEVVNREFTTEYYVQEEKARESLYNTQT